VVARLGDALARETDLVAVIDPGDYHLGQQHQGGDHRRQTQELRLSGERAQTMADMTARALSRPDWTTSYGPSLQEVVQSGRDSARAVMSAIVWARSPERRIWSP
jgi:hypothetical protein